MDQAIAAQQELGRGQGIGGEIERDKFAGGVSLTGGRPLELRVTARRSNASKHSRYS